jgi:putative DNA methylase
VTTANRPRKLIEVALPLDEINAACKADKDRKTGTIRNIHKWFAPMPLPAWRALIFAALIDDPADDEKRAYLLDVIKRLVTNGADLPDIDTMEEACKIIAEQFPEGVPTVMDPFCGGGSTLIEAQRLGLNTYGSDLNPVPVLITRMLTDIAPSVMNRPSLHDTAAQATRASSGSNGTAQIELIATAKLRQYSAPQRGLTGLAADVRHYASVVHERLQKRLSDAFPHQAGERPLAWLWARTCTCPNPACSVETVLATQWWLSKKQSGLAWMSPRAEMGVVQIDIVSDRESGAPPPPPKIGRGGSFVCLACNQAIKEPDLIEEAEKQGLGLRLLAVASERGGRRVFRAPTGDDVAAYEGVILPEDAPGLSLGPAKRYVSPPRFGITTFADLFNRRQLLTMIILSDLVAGVYDQVLADGGDETWATAITTMLGLAVGKRAQYGSSLSGWKLDSRGGTGKPERAFPRNDLPMAWDFAEANPLGTAAGSWIQCVETMLDALPLLPAGRGTVVRRSAVEARVDAPALVATDPPYFDAIGYADLSDFFYIWHRRALRRVHPDLYATIAAPKAGELTAFPAHHGDSDRARQYFIDGFTQTFQNLQVSSAEDLPILVVYASKEQKGGPEEETRWSSILTAIVAADLAITGTWPILGTGGSRMRGLGSNAVATYVVMVCRPRPETAGTCSVTNFNRALRRELKPAVHDFQAAGILPVDLAQTAMGPGMQVYSRYRAVLDQSGERVSVEQALRLINAALGEVLDEQEGELDPYSRFAIAWWEKHGWIPAAFGEADKLARPQGISVDDLIRAEVAYYPKPGFVALLGGGGLERTWQPPADKHATAWEAVHHLADRLIDGGGAMDAGRLMKGLGSFRDPAQALVYRLHDIAAKKGRTKDQERYNALIGSWSDLLAVAASERDGLF